MSVELDRVLNREHENPLSVHLPIDCVAEINKQVAAASTNFWPAQFPFEEREVYVKLYIKFAEALIRANNVKNDYCAVSLTENEIDDVTTCMRIGLERVSTYRRYSWETNGFVVGAVSASPETELSCMRSAQQILGALANFYRAVNSA